MIDRYPELVVRPTSADDVVAAIRFGARGGAPDRRPQRRPQHPRPLDLRRRDRHRPVADERRARRRRRAHRVGERRCAPRRARPRGAGGRARLPGRRRLPHGRRRPDARRRHGAAPAQARAHDRQPPRGRARHRRRPAGPGERRGARGPLLGAPRGRRQLRDRDGLPLPPASARVAGHARDGRPPDRAGDRARRALPRARGDRARRAVGELLARAHAGRAGRSPP